MQVIKDYIELDKFLYDIWWFRRHINTPLGIIKILFNPMSFLKMVRAYKKFTKSGEIDDWDKVVDNANLVYKLSESIKLLLNFHRGESIFTKRPINIIVSSYLVNQYPNTDFKKMINLNKMYTPNQSKLFNIKTLLILISLFIALLFRKKPKKIEEFFDFSYIYEDKLNYIFAVFIIGYSIYTILIVLYNKSRQNSLLNFKNKCLESCQIIKEPNNVYN